MSVVSAATLDWHGGLVVSATALSVVASPTLLRGSRAVVSTSSDGHCDCDGGWDEEKKEINFEWALGEMWLALSSASGMGVADLLGVEQTKEIRKWVLRNQARCRGSGFGAVGDVSGSLAEEDKK